MAESDRSTICLRDETRRDVLRIMARWGFAVMEPVHRRSPGFRVLAVAMRATPTRAHFDPEALAIPIFGEGQQASEVTWHRESRCAPAVRVYPGSIWVADRVKKQVNFYSYGGTLHTIHDGTGCTIYVMTSDAPILSLGTQVTSALEDQLAMATEALMARLRATALCRGVELPSRLAEHDPLTRYAGCITSLLQNYHQSSSLAQTFPGFFGLLKREAAWLAEQPGIRPVPLEQLVGLAPAAAAQQFDSR